jgi:hypothetical protein
MEEVPSSFCLGIGGILDLYQTVCGEVRISLPLRHNALKVEPLRSFEELAPMLLHREHAGQVWHCCHAGSARLLALREQE